MESTLPKPKRRHLLPTRHQDLSPSSWCSMYSSLFQIASSHCRTCVTSSSGVRESLWRHKLGHLKRLYRTEKGWVCVGFSSSMSHLTCAVVLVFDNNGLRLSVSITMIEKMSHVIFVDPRFERRARFTIKTSLFKWQWPSAPGRGLALSSLVLSYCWFKKGSMFKFLYFSISFFGHENLCLACFWMLLFKFV